MMLLAALAGVLSFVAASGGTVPEVKWKTFRGMCDASAVEMLSNDLFVAGNDEDNVLRVYSRSREGLPVQVLDFSAHFHFPRKAAETDLEGSARIGDLIFWTSSHGANANGKFQPSRHRLFATQVVTNSGVSELRPYGQVYSTLLRDLTAEKSLLQFKLAAAARRAPKDRDALNIEALAATPQRGLLIGFRNPIPGGKALIVPLLNPVDVVAGKKARFGEPRLLELHGHGIRSMISVTNGYLIVAGSYRSGGSSKLYHWTGDESAPHALGRNLPGNPEGIALVEGSSGAATLLVLNDDGTRDVLGTECKKVKNQYLRTFRAYELPLDF